MTNNRFPLSKVFLAMLLTSQGALAQGTDANNTSEIEKITVTGLKQDRTLHETPVSVAVTSANEIAERALFDIYDVLEQVPNVVVGSNDFSIRGINVFGVDTTSTGGGTNNALASLYVDGAPMPYRMIQQGALTAWDIEQVEVLRGPQSTLQGKNTLSGAIVMTTARPTYDWDGKFRINAGNDGRREYAFAGGGSLIENQLAFRIVAETADHDGFNDAPNQPQNSDYSEADNLRAKLLWEPESIDGFTAMLSYTNTKSDNGVKFVDVPSDKANFYSNRSLDLNVPTHEFTDSELFNLQLEYEINDNWSFTSITAYTDADYGYEWDSDASPLPLAQQFDNRNDETFNQEFRLVFDYDNLSGVVGAFYSDLESGDKYTGNQLLPFAALGVDQLLTQTLVNSFGFDLATATATTDGVMGIYAATGSDPADLGLNGNNQQNIETMALFGDLTYALNDQWDLLFGVRFDKEEQSFSSIDNYAINSSLPNPTDYDPTTSMIIDMLNTTIQGMAAQASTETPKTSASFTEVLPKAGVTFKPNDDINYSFIYQQGYRSGGTGYNLIRGQAYTYDAEFTDNYELSVRSIWLAGDLVINANLFYIDWTDQQLTVQLSAADNDTEVVNAGKSDVTGFEVDGRYKATDSISLYGGFGYSDTQFKEYENNGEVYDGRPFAGAPRWTANAGINFDNDSGFLASININYSDKSIAELVPNGTDGMIEPYNDSRVLVDTRLGYEWGSNSEYGIFVIAKNLFDEEYRLNSATITAPASHTLGDPRQFSVEFRADF